MIKRTAFALLMAVAALLQTENLRALPISALVGPENEQALRTAGSVKQFQLKDPQVGLAPEGEIGETVKALIKDFDPSLIVETLYLYPKPEGTPAGAWSDEERTAVYNAIRAISTLAGIEYYSASRKRMRVFYETSKIIDGPDSDVELPDPVVSDLPARSTIYAVQKDLSFGENRYRYDYLAGDSWLAFVQGNLTTMKYKLIPVLGKGKLKTAVFVADVEDSLLVYAISAARALSVPGLEGKIRDSFSNRADAIYGWFVTRADAAFRSASHND